ncbi:MAG TPA: acyl-CoA dehydrogenase family protein [Streptosporangiaceae bacterium]|nr:acyl-CoA dehydrogenase family protein [Streptosporangiaceae bacterium]
MRDSILSCHHLAFRAAARAFVATEVAPHYPDWERTGTVDRGVWRAAGRAGLLGLDVPTEYGGAGLADFRYHLLLAEELAQYRGVGFNVHNDVVAPYLVRLTDPEQRRRWLPGFCSGKTVTAVAMTEPDGGSDLAAMRTTATRDGDTYVVNGVKTLITNGTSADLVVVAAVTDAAQVRRGGGVSLLVLEHGMPGFERGGALDTIGLRAAGTASLSFDHVHVPACNLLGAEGRGMTYLQENLTRERLSIAGAAVAGAETVLAETITYCQRRHAFGQPIGSFQHNRFALAEMHTELAVTRTYVDQCVLDFNAASLTPITAAQAKWWATDVQRRTVDRCLQLHGGAGYLRDCPAARAFVDTRVMPIYGGTNEVMKEVIGRSLGV